MKNVHSCWCVCLLCVLFVCLVYSGQSQLNPSVAELGTNQCGSVALIILSCFKAYLGLNVTAESI